MSPAASSREQQQLELGLFRGVPWDGHSPRALTRVRTGLILRQAPPFHEVFFNADQLELWPIERSHREKSPRTSGPGASLLLETLTRRNHGTR